VLHLSTFGGPLISILLRREGVDELRNLRLASKILNSLATPLLFETLCLSFNNPSCSFALEIIAALAAGSTTVFQSTKNLSLSTTHSFFSLQITTGVMLSKVCMSAA
jgi:hypothetical protein